MEQLLADEIIDTEYGQLDLAWSEDGGFDGDADRVRWMSWAGETSGNLDVPPGSYRLRVSARGRDLGAADELAEEVVDHYRLELWSAPSQKDTIIRVGTDDARYWHTEWGGRR